MKKKNEELIEKLLIDHYDKYYRMAFRYGKSEQNAMDIVQEAAYKAIYYSDKLKNCEYADSWICRIVMNEANTFMKKNSMEYTELDQVAIGVDKMEETYDSLDLKDALAKLPIGERELIWLRFFEDMSLEEIARTLNQNLSTVKSRLYRTMGKLRLSLGGDRYE